MAQTRIVVKEPNGVQRTMPLTPRGLSIGRGSDNSLVVNYPTASRYHAQITFDGGYYYVTDLNSGNGTYLGETRLPPNEPVAWMPGTPLHVSDVVVQLEEGQYQPQAQQPKKPGSRGRQSTETITGWVPLTDDTQDKSKNRVLTIVLLVGVFLCACAALGTAGYFLFAAG